MLEDLGRSPLRIAVVAPPWFPVPPSGYGGIEAMVHALVEGLVDRDHDVVLVGAGTPRSSAKFLRTYEEAPLERMGEALPEIVHSLEAAEHLKGLEELPDAIRRVDQLDPKACRRRVFDCFDVPDMVEGYEVVYRRAVLRASNRPS